MKDRKLKLALVGCGGIARAHLDGIQRIATRIEVTAVVDINPANLQDMAARTGAPAFADLSSALAEGDFDAVDIMLPHDVHEQAAELAFAAGKHVLLEKPMAVDLASCARIIDLAKRAGTRFMVAEQAQYWPDIVRARELIDAGEIGDVLFADARFYDRVKLPTAGARPWRFILAHAGGGITMDGGAHWIRPLRMMLGEVREVIAVTGHHVPGMEGESRSQSLLRFESGVTATFTTLNLMAAAAPIELFRVTGTAGEIVIPGGREAQLMLFNQRHPKGHAVMDAVQGKADSYGMELKDFEELVLDGKAPVASAEYSLGELRTALAMYRSVTSGRWESVWDPA